MIYNCFFKDGYSMRYLLILLLLSTSLSPLRSQIVHSESFSKLLDSTKTLKGSVVPDLEYSSQKKDLIEFENTMDISFTYGEHALTIANQIELSQYGSEILLSGGYLYMEYRNFHNNIFSLQPYNQVMWARARGLALKYAAGVYGRVKLVEFSSLGLYAGTGPLYEFEKWNYDGVKDNNLPEKTNDKYKVAVKWGSYISFLWESGYNFIFDASIYHQSRLNGFISEPRVAASTSLTYEVTEHVGVILQYRNIYDYDPVVPIDKLYTNVVFSMDLSF